MTQKSSLPSRQNFGLLLVLLSMGHLQTLAGAQTQTKATLSEREAVAVDEAVRTEMTEQQAAGVAIGIIRNNQIVYLNGYGWANAQKRVPVASSTLFRWASISKTLTAVTALQLAEQGQLDLGADVRQYVPEFPDKGAPITARQLLCHQSGIPHYGEDIIPAQKTYDVEHPFADVVTALDTFKESQLLFSPGEKFFYSTFGFILLSALVQRAGEQPFAKQVQERISAPLGLKTLQPDYQWVDIPNRASGYSKKGGNIVPSTDTDVSWKLGGGGFISNIEDLTRFAQGLLQKRLLQPQTYAAMWQPQKTKDGTLTNWGLGFALQIGANGNLKVSHDGKQEKATCRMVLYPQQKSGVVVMTNCDYAEPGRISTAIFSALNAATTDQ